MVWDCGTDSDLHIVFFLKNQVAALRKGVVGVTKELMGIKELDLLPGFGVNLESVVAWSAREMRLHGHAPEELTFNLKMDGRPFYGKC